MLNKNGCYYVCIVQEGEDKMNWIKEFIAEQKEGIKKAAGDSKVAVGLSGGVDSSVVAMLAHRVLPPDQVLYLTIDDGFRRKDEPQWVWETFKRLDIPVEVVSITEKLRGRQGQMDPWRGPYYSLRQAKNAEKKRIWFRRFFYEVLAFEAKKQGAIVVIQGTNKADVSETVNGIKIQHNVLGQIGIDPFETYGIKIYEPIAELYKDQSREVARALDLPEKICGRIPFPGPGLSIRVYEEPSESKIALIREVTAILERLLLPFNPFQVLAYLGPKATGVSTKGERVYGYTIYIRVVNSTDAITATPLRISSDIEDKVVTHITNTFPDEVSHVLFDRTPKPPGTIEFE